jgi:hypothetical protein
MAVAVPAVPPGQSGRVPFVGTPATPNQDSYKFAVGPWADRPDTELSRITQRTVTWRLKDNSDASFVIDGTLPEAASISELISGLWVYRNGVPIYKGLCGATSDSGGTDSHTIQMSSADYRAVLVGRRLIYDHDQLIYSGVDQGDFCWDLIDNSQLRPGGDLGIVRGSTLTGVTVSPQLTPGAFVGEQINTMGVSAQTFDWDLTPSANGDSLTFDMWVPERGVDRQTVLDFPEGRINTFTRNVDPGSYANAVRGTGADGLAAIAADSPTVQADPTPRLEANLSDTDMATQSGLADWVTGQLATAQTVTPTWTVTLPPNGWGGPSDFWLGDPIILSVKSGVRQVYGSLRVFEIALTLDDNSDAATVQVTLGGPNPNRKWRLTNFARSIAKLSKR